MKFSDFQFSDSLNKVLDKAGYQEPTPIQQQTIPQIIDGHDIAGLAQTGTGKTAAFLLPLIERILWSRKNPSELNDEDKAIYSKRAFPDWKGFHYILVLVPTRELAEQVLQNLEMFGGETEMKGVAIYGGTSYDKQKDAVKRGVDFIVATPGRLIDLYKENIIDLKLVRAIVFDEADRMFDMGFKDDMKYILQRVPKERQFIVYSATLNFDVLNTAYQFGANPIEYNVSRDQAKAENVKDNIYHVGQEEKPQFLLSILKKNNPKQTIIFSNFKNNIDRIVGFLNLNGVPAMGISSLLTQAQRNKVIEQFKAENDQNILVATDVAARGLDIKGVDLVINFDLPNDPESYVHRIGRTGRAGAEGRAVSFVSDRDVDALVRVEEYLKNKLETVWLEDAEILKDFKVMPFEREQRKDFRSHSQNSRGGDRGPRRNDRDPRRTRPEREGQPQGRRDQLSKGRRFEPRNERNEFRGQTSNKPHQNKDRQQFKPHQKSNPNVSQHSNVRRDHQKNRPVQKQVMNQKQKSISQKVVGFLKALFK